MAIKVDLVRPDDLLNLRIEGTNLRIDSEDPANPVVVVENAEQPAFLIVTFPPQTIAESAYFESSIVEPDGDKEQLENHPDPKLEPGTVHEPLDPPGQPRTGNTSAQLAQPSRLVFLVPADARIPFSIEGLLDWSNLTLNVNPIAAIGPEPTDDQIFKAPAIQKPAANETALELPYRLIISPNSDVTWSHRAQPMTTRGRTELWHTRLELKAGERSKPFRAIWSPDYAPHNPPPPAAEDKDLGRTAMSANDRHQIVILTSAFRGYEVEARPTLAADLAPRFGPSDSMRALLLSLDDSRLSRMVPYIPLPFDVEQLMLTPLGGWLRSRGNWRPPHTAPPVVLRPEIDLNRIVTREPLFQPRVLSPARPILSRPRIDVNTSVFADPEEESLDLSEWVHLATQGRDHYVRIVYEGELLPFCHRASLIKITERKFIEKNGVICAYLMQRMYIVVREPEKRFPRDERSMPFKRVRLTTLVTPDIASPSYIAGSERSFWVEVMTPARDLFKFSAIGLDVVDAPVDFTIPMIFVSKKDYDKKENLKQVALHYNDPSNYSRREAVVPGQKVWFAEPDPASPNDNTRYVTKSINFVVRETGCPPQMLKSDSKVPPVSDLLGTDAATTIAYYKNYVDSGFDAQTGVFAKVVKVSFTHAGFDKTKPFTALLDDTMGVSFSSDQAGGFATPNLGVTTLTRALGPLAGKVEDAVTNTFKPEEFFKKGMAQLFGSLDLVDLLVPGLTHDQNAPKIVARTEDVPGGKLIVATMDWEPEIRNLPFPDVPYALVRFQKKANTKLRIHGRIEKPLKLENLAAPPAQGAKFEFDGKLNDFTVGILESVFLNFVEFTFNSRANQKLDVNVKLDPETPMRFAGDLEFVEELRKAIPPDLFGKGPSIELLSNPPGVRAGFAFALPPVAVGVFALKDISLGAALTLPFLDGKPVFDFNVSERARPFLLSVAIFGGGGFFHLQLDTAGIKMLEAAFEFGATAAIDIGVASGEVHIMAGIYFAIQRKDPGTDMVCRLTGYLRMGGSLSVLGIVKISVEFNLSFTYDSGTEKAYGRATLTVQVEVLFFSMAVELTVEKAFGGSSGDPKFAELMNTPEAWNEYALAFA